jgi:hypothetical protein
MLNAVLSIAMLSAFLLLYGAWKRWSRDGASQQMWLMIAAALVILRQCCDLGCARSNKAKALLPKRSNSLNR